MFSQEKFNYVFHQFNLFMTNNYSIIQLTSLICINIYIQIQPLRLPVQKMCH